MKLVNFQDGLIDVCVRYGHGVYENLDSHWLMNEILYPVCHPNYQRQHGIYSLNDLVRAELIEDVLPDMNWEIWFDMLHKEKSSSPIRYDGSQFVMEGVLASQGVALVKHSLAQRFINEGKLVRIDNYAVQSRYSYFFMCAEKGNFRYQKNHCISRLDRRSSGQLLCNRSRANKTYAKLPQQQSGLFKTTGITL